MNSDISDDERDMAIERSLHTKLASPRRLLVEMKEMVGDGHFKIEVSSAPGARDNYENDALKNLPRCVTTSITSGPRKTLILNSSSRTARGYDRKKLSAQMRTGSLSPPSPLARERKASWP